MVQRRYPNAAYGGFPSSRGGYQNPHRAGKIDLIQAEEEEAFGKGAGAAASASTCEGEGAKAAAASAKAAASAQTAASAKAAASAQTDQAAKDAKAVEAMEADVVEDDTLVAEAESVVAEAANQSEELATARKEAADWQDRYMRLHAEWDTYRRRSAEQQAQDKKRATEKLIENLLPVIDDFERMVTYAEQNGEQGLLDGVKAVQTKLVDALVKDGLEVINPVGQPYDALEAQAVSTVPNADAFEETVQDVFQKGYKLGNKVLRPAMVTVTTGGPQRPKDETDKAEGSGE